jgi:hypothetical protein
VIPLEGRIVPGLDEFMLRLGHLKVLCGVAEETGGTWSRIAREAAVVLTRPVPIPDERRTDVARYLRKKRFCPVRAPGGQEGDAREDYRYPDLAIIADPDGDRLVATGDDPVRIWWQDLCLAEPGIRSRVGAITATRAKSGSKTGLSHICDWSTALDLISSAGQLTPEGRLLARLSPGRVGDRWSANPYFIGGERIVFGSALLSADMDLFSRFAVKLVGCGGGVKKADGARLFVTAMEEIGTEADAARYLSQGQQYRIAQHIRELEHAVRQGGVRVGELWSSSTAWHRAASRLESYVDLGLLEKGVTGEDERYEYVYHVAEPLRRCVATLEGASSAEDWVEAHLAGCLLGLGRERERLDPEDLLACLPRIIAALERPTAPVSIGALALGFVWLKADDGDLLSLRAARAGIEELARRRPDVARLSRGGSGERAEFVSFELGKVGL